MSFVKKLANMFAKNKDKIEELKWDINFGASGITLAPNKNLKELDDIVDILEMYNIGVSDENNIEISYEDIYELYYDEFDNNIDTYKYLNLPEMFKGVLKIENRNNFLVDKEVSFVFSFTGANGAYTNKYGNILFSDLHDEYKVMPKSLFELVKQIKGYNTDINQRSDEATQFEMLKIIKDYTQEVDIILNDRLRSEETPIIIDKIKIDFNDNGEVLEVYPRLSDDEAINKKLLGSIDSYDNVKGMYSAQVDGKKVRYVIKHKDTLDTIRKNRVNKGVDRLNVLSGRNELFQDENIDITDFGPRVTGIGYLTYKNSPSSVQTNDLDWLDNNVELPYIQGTNVNGDCENIILKPNDRERLQCKLVDMNIEDIESSEVDFTTDSGNIINIIMTKDEIKQEIQKLNSRIKMPSDVKKVKDLEELISICDNYKDEDFIEYKGMYIDKGRGDIKEELIEQLEELRTKESDDSSKSKRKTLLIAENIDEEEYKETENIKKYEHKVELPKGLLEKFKLFEYQEECLCKLQSLYLQSNINGFLLCDDMGLGKTIQLLAFLGWLKERNEVTPSLIVAPTSLLNNWAGEPEKNMKGEIQKFFGDDFFKVEKVRGTLSDADIERIKDKDIVLITYESLRLNNIKLGKINWKVMICDEAQKIKTPKTMVTIAAKAQNANFKIICSATPIENSLEDLWTLVDYSKPGLLGSLKEFKVNYINKAKGMSNEQLQDTNDRLTSAIEAFYLRREKDILPKALPKKIIKIYKVRATAQEQDILERIKDTEEHTITAIQKMIAICSHIDLLNKDVPTKHNIKNLINQSPKLLMLKEILEDIKAKDEKVIIFSRLKKVQQILYLAIQEWFGITSHIVNGEETNLDKRTARIDDFRADKGFSAIILSPDVAGFGITLTEANHVIHYSRMWNPAKEDQATDRAYRIGQTKDVTVHYPILTYEKNTVLTYENVTDYVKDNFVKKNDVLTPEEKLNLLLARKKDMLLNFFLAAGNGEISTKDFISLDDKKENKNKVTMSYILDNAITPHEFEALVAVIYEKLGYKSYLTSRSNDKGVDVVAIKGNDVLFIQCKKTNSTVGSEAVKDILFAKSSYKAFVGNKNIKGLIVTTSNDIANSIINNNEELEIINGDKLGNMLNEYSVYMDEVDIKDKERHSFEMISREIEK